MSGLSVTHWPKAVVFDWDETLVDTQKVCYDAYSLTVQKFTASVSATLQDFHEEPRHSARDAFARKFGERALEAEEFFYENLCAIHLESLRPLPGAEKLLQLLVGRNIYIGVASNKLGDVLRREVNHLGWDRYFYRVIGSRDTPEDKPSPLPLQAALRGAKSLSGPDVWFVGDSEVDMICAQKAFCTPVAVGTTIQSQNISRVHGKDCLGLANMLMKL